MGDQLSADRALAKGCRHRITPRAPRGSASHTEKPQIGRSFSRSQSVVQVDYSEVRDAGSPHTAADAILRSMPVKMIR